MNDLRVFLFKITLGVTFFLGLGWVSLFLTPQPALAVRKTADDIYVQPIKGLDKTGIFGPNQSEIAEAIIQDNYQVYCAAPAQEMSAEIGQKYIRYLELYFGKLKIHKIATTVEAGDDIFNPLILDDTGEEQTAVFKEDKQSYVQYLNSSKADADPIQEQLATADYYKLLSLQEQCEVQKEAQKRVIYLCNKLENTPLSECPLNITIPNTSAEIAEVDIPSCNNITDPELIANLSQSSTLVSLANLPLSQVYGKRPAYLLTCVEQKKSGGSIYGGGSIEDLALYMWTNWKNILSSLFGGLRHKLDQKKDECHVRSILVDSPTTEQEKVNSIEAHNISRNVLTPWTDQIEIEKAYQKEKAARREIVLGEIASGFSNEDRVNLVGSANVQTKALTQMVNGLAPVCDNSSIRPEDAPTITSEANFSEGGPLYKASKRTAANDFGLLDSLRALLEAEIETGERTKNDIENRNVTVETFLIAPYDAQITLDQFFSPLEEYTITKEQAESIWPSHVFFNKGIGEGQEYNIGTGSNKSEQKFWDPDDCKVTPGHYNKNGEWQDEELDCWQSYNVGISNMEQSLGVDVIADKTRGNVRAMQSLFPYDEPAYKHVERFGSSTEANNEKLIKGDGGNSRNDGEDDDEEDVGPVVAQCDGGPRITSGEGAQHICQDIGPCTGEELSASGSCTLLESQHIISAWQNGGDSYKPCSEELYSYVACTYPDTLIANSVDSQGKFTKDGTMTACEYVVSEAKSAGVSPRFALAMWGEESGWSHHRDAYALGVTSEGKLDLGSQVSAFLGTVNGKSDYLTFMKQYSAETSSTNVFCTNPHFPARLKEMYDFL
jgi:hypothetical protein